MENVVNVPARTMESVMAEVKAAISHVNQTALLGTVKVGNCFKELKELVPHGEWLSYIEENIQFSARKVQQFIQISEEYGDENSEFFKLLSNAHICADLSFSKALRLLSLPEAEVESFVENNNVSDLTVKELEEKIKDLQDRAADAEDSARWALEESEARIRELEERLAEMESASELEESSSSEDLQKEIEALRTEVEKQKEKEEKLKEKIKAAEEKREASESAVREEAFAAGQEEMKRELEADLREKESKAEEAEERAAAAERKLSAVKNEDLVIFKVKADELQRIFEDIVRLIRDIEEADAEQAVKLRGALEKLVGALEARI